MIPNPKWSPEREEVCNLLESAGIDYKAVTQDGIYDDGYVVVVTDAYGRIQSDPLDPSRVLTRFHPWTMSDELRQAILAAYQRFSTAQIRRDA